MFCVLVKTTHVTGHALARIKPHFVGCPVLRYASGFPELGRKTHTLIVSNHDFNPDPNPNTTGQTDYPRAKGDTYTAQEIHCVGIVGIKLESKRMLRMLGEALGL